MDKYEFNIKVEQIKKMVGKNDYETAMKIADTIDWRRVRNTNLLSMVAMVYEKNEDYQEAKEILLQAYERAPIGKRLLYKLAELAVKEGNIGEAESYYKEFGDLASEDPRQQLLRYMILKAKGAPAQQLIHSLESYTSVELDEKWLYELAELYSLAGMAERCVETCDRIMLMFGLGKYVEKAMDLKVQYAPLTNYQMDLIENRDKYEARLRAVEKEYGTGKKVSVQLEPEMDYYQEGPESGQYTNMVYEETAEDDYEASIQEAEVQESLAREMSRISYDEPAIEEEPAAEHTRVLEDIRRVGRNISAIPRPQGNYMPEEEEEKLYSEPVIEEDELQEFGQEAYEIQSAAAAENDLDNIDYEDETYDEFAGDMGDEEEQYSNYYEEEDLAFQQADKNGYNFPQAEEEEEELDFEELYGEEAEEDMQELPVRNHLMIEARTAEKGLQMAVEALKQIHRESGVNNPVARITGSRLSKRGIFASADKLAGKDLVIEEAGDLTPEALDELNQLMDRDASGMIVVLIDNPKQMEALHQDHPALASKFECIGSGEEVSAHSPAEGDTEAVKVRNTYQKDSAIRKSDAGKLVREVSERDGYSQESHYAAEEFQQRREYSYGDEYDQESGYEEDDFYDESADDSVNESSYRHQVGTEYSGEEMDIDEFAQYACRYANEIDCNITGKSMLALYERIEIMEEDGVPLNRANAESLIEEAADRAEKPSMGRRIKGLFSTKYDKDGLLILKEEHFIY